MNNFVIDRFPKSQPVVSNQPNIPKPIIKKEHPIIEPEILRKELLNKLNPIPEIITSELTISFPTVFEFVNWYEHNKEKFSPIQQKPLDNLIAARNMASGGCNCDIQTRRLIAADWFRKFWINNKNTDLPPTLLKIANAKKVVFGDFLTYP